MTISLAIPLTLREIAALSHSRLIASEETADTVIRRIVTDSREVEEGDLFFAIPGESFDGHSYLSAVEAGGAAAFLGERLPADVSLPALICPSTVRGIGELARNYAKRIPHKTVAVTGSVGKTTTKEYIAATLSAKYTVFKTAGNLNNELGLPYTLLSMPADTEILVVEMGMSGRGEIAALSKIATPDTALITTIGTSHLEHLGSRENICLAKAEIEEGLSPTGAFFLNGDEPLLRAHRPTCHAPAYITLGENGDFCGQITEQNKNGTRIRYTGRKYKGLSLSLPTVGEHNVYAALFACAVAEEYGLSPAEIQRGLLSYLPAGLRQHTEEIAGLTLLIDCYNAAPESMRAASQVLRLLASESGGRMCAVLGEMKELGQDSAQLHRKTAADMVEAGLSLLFTYGDGAAAYAEGAVAAGMRRDRILSFSDGDAVGCAAAILRHCGKGDVILLKASRAVRAEKVVQALKDTQL